MSVIPITLFFSLLLAGTFVVLFAREHRRRRFASAERDSLLPLADETPRAAGWASVSPFDELRTPSPSRGTPTPIADVEIGDHLEPDHEHDHAHAGGACGCKDGTRPPCVGCLRRRDEPASLSS